jgi:hypothetical protein
MRNIQLQNRRRLLQLNERILRDNGLLIGRDLYDPRGEGREIRIDRRRRRYTELVNELANLVEPAQQPSNDLEPDFDIWFPNMVDGLQQLVGQEVNLRWNNQVDSGIFRVPANRAILRKEIRARGFWVNSDMTIFGEYQNTTGEYPPAVEVSIINNVERVRLMALDMKENAKATSTKRKYNALYNKAIKLEKEFIVGVPQEDIQKICNTLQIGLDITLPLLDDNFISCRSMKKPLKVFKFVNTRLNHIELGGVVGKNNTRVRGCSR